MKFGAWFHSHNGITVQEQLHIAKALGIDSVRSYSYDYSEELASTLKELDLSLYAGMHVDAEQLIEDWRSQVRLEELDNYHQLGVPVDAICVGNELRQFGDHPDKKRFTSKVSFGLANVIETYRRWMDERGYKTPLTYAMEGIVFNQDGGFQEHVKPVIDACDIISVNLYPMGRNAWHGPEQFEESRLFLHDGRVRNNRMLQYETQLRSLLEGLSGTGKSVILSETGFPSAVRHETDEHGRAAAVSDNEKFGEAMEQLLQTIARANADYPSAIKAVYFYEWRDNQFHPKITNIEDSPIHCAFGMCDRFGTPKFDIRSQLAKFAD